MRATRVLTVDDEPLALRRLQLALSAMDDVDQVGAAHGVEEGTRLIAERAPDVLLLDIKMRDGSGFDLLDRLPDAALPAVIFITAFDEFAVKAFEVRAVDYLLKPVDFDRLREAIVRARQRIEERDAGDRIAELRELVATLREEARKPPAPRYETEFWIRRNGADFVRVAADSIDWAAAEEDYVRLHADGRSFLLRETISGLQARLEPGRFVRVHRSTLVRIDAIAQVKRGSIGLPEVELRGGERLRVGRVHAKGLRKLLTARPS